jgi:hypothetical protein
LKRLFATLAVCLATVGPALALAEVTKPSTECLHLEDERFDVEDTELGFGLAEWRATLANDCNHGFDARIELELLDGEGAVVTTYTVVAIARAHGIQALTKKIHLSRDTLEEVARTRSTIDARPEPR